MVILLLLCMITMMMIVEEITTIIVAMTVRVMAVHLLLHGMIVLLLLLVVVAVVIIVAIHLMIKLFSLLLSPCRLLRITAHLLPLYSLLCMSNSRSSSIRHNSVLTAVVAVVVAVAKAVVVAVVEVAIMLINRHNSLAWMSMAAVQQCCSRTMTTTTMPLTMQLQMEAEEVGRNLASCKQTSMICFCANFYLKFGSTHFSCTRDLLNDNLTHVCSQFYLTQD